MSVVTLARTLYLIVINIYLKDGQDLPTILNNMANVFVDSDEVIFLLQLKVTGESRLVLVANGTAAGIDTIADELFNIAPIDIDSQPLIPYEDFARGIGVPANLTQYVSPSILRKTELYWLTMKVDYFGNTTQEFIASWRNSSIGTLTGRYNNATRPFVFYKNLAENILQVIINIPDPVATDFNAFFFGLVQDFGSNVRFESKSVLFLSQYLKYVNEDSGY